MKLSVVVPAHNEEENIPPLVSSFVDFLSRQGWDYEIVIVDDHSSDSTGRLVDEYAVRDKRIVAVHRRSGKGGMGFALREGTAKATGDIIIWAMADRSDSLNTFKLMVEKIGQGCDMVFASRYMPGGSGGDTPFFRVLVAVVFSLATKLIFPGVKVHDISNAFRCFRKKVFDSLVLESGDFAISPELAIKAYRAGFRLCEVPTTHSYRKAGKSSFKFAKMGFRYASVYKYKFVPKSSFLRKSSG